MATADSDDWPDDLERAAAAHDLGPLVLWQRTDLKRNSRILVVPFVLSVILLVFAIRSAIRDQQSEGAWYFSLGLLVVALLPAAFGAYMLIRTRRTPARWIGIHQNGLIFQVGGQEPFALAWPEVDYVSRSETRVEMNGMYTHTTYSTVIRGAGQGIALDNTFGAVAELSEEIAARSGKEMRKRLSAVIESGGSATFYPCSVSREGVTYQGALLPWSRISGVRVREGQVRITEEGQSKPWATFPASGFPNLAVFLALTHTLRTANRG